MTINELKEQMNTKVNREVTDGEHSVTLTSYTIECSPATTTRPEQAWVKLTFNDSEGFEWSHNVFAGRSLDIAVSHLRKQLAFKTEFNSKFDFFQHILDNKLSIKAYAETVLAEDATRSFRNVNFLPPIAKPEVNNVVTKADIDAIRF